MTPRPPSQGSRCPGIPESARSPIAAWWSVCCTFGVSALTWSGRFYLPYPLFCLPVVLAAVVGWAASWWLASRPGAAVPGRLVLLTGAPLLLFLGLVSVGIGSSDPLTRDYHADLDAYRGGCLAGTDYGGDAFQLVTITADSVIVYPWSEGEPLRFTRTGHSWPSRERAEFGGEGVTPADDLTRTILAAHGCP
ncbi:hypothetical protein ABJI51_16750 [Amycolatopsis sp. NEAU-NG30]|uniref:Uncharacterized protein n=1 Tax=Amycolatopsis melonis TaxID=3156488 RepID=A0ABV0LHB1_9PSEU